MSLRIATRYLVGVVDESLAHLRVHSASLTSLEDIRLTADGALAVVERAFQRNPGLSQQLRKRVRAHWYRAFGRGLARRGRTPDARLFFTKAIEQQPLQVAPYLLWMSTWLL